MAEIDPSKDMKAADARAKRLIADLERQNRIAEQARVAAEKDAKFNERLRNNLEKEAAQARARERTVTETGRGTPVEAAKSKGQEASAAKEVEKATRTTKAQEEAITKARRESSSLLQRDLETLRRYGPAAGEKYLARQGRTESQLTTLQRLRAEGVGLTPRPMLPAIASPMSSKPGASQPVARPTQTGYVAGPGGVEAQIAATKRLQAAEAAAAASAAREAAERQAANARQAEALRARATALGQMESKLGSVAASERQVFSQVQAGTDAYARNSSVLRRHGALTTEFIASAQRGTATIREMGYQLGATAGKFGGWLAAGSAIFTALTAIRQIGQGAIESASGVNQLNRVLVQDVNADEATESFRELSKQFNLPIDQVTDAAYGMAKVFQTQEGAMEGAKAALFAVKVGELDVATATRYLTAIVNGFALPADQMMRVMDQLNEAQNRFGVSIPDTAAGVAKAAGTFRAAGGEINSLIALITTAQKATGQTGQVIGTALARSPNFLRQDTNQEVLRSFGINASDDIDKIIERAFVVGKDLGGEKLQQLASAIFGPQYGARVGTPLLQSFDRYKKALRETSPQAAAGSAQRELNTLLGSMQERLSAIGNSLQILGSNLADAGILAPLSVALRTLQSLLDVTNALLDLFNELPAPIRLLVTNLGMAYGALRLMRRLQVGDLFPEGSWGRKQFTPPDMAMRRYRESLYQIEQFTNTELEAVGKQQAVAASKYEYLQSQVPGVQTATRQLVLGGGEESVQEFEAISRRSEALHDAILAAETTMIDAEAQERALLERRKLIAEQNAMIRLGANRAEVAALYGATLHPEGAVQPQGAAALRALVAEDTAGMSAERLAQRNAALARLRIYEGTWQYRLRQTASRLGSTSRVLAAGTAGVGRMVGGLKAAGSSLLGFGRSLAAMIGPLDAILIGAIAGYMTGKHISDVLNKPVEGIDKLIGKSAESRKAFERQNAELQKQRQDASDISGWEAAYGTAGDFLDNTVLRLFPGDQLPGPDDSIRAAEAASRWLELRKRQAAIAAAAIKQGDEVVGAALGFVFPEDIQRALDKSIAAFNEGRIGATEFTRRTQNFLRSVRGAYELSNKTRRDLISSIKTAAIDTRGLSSGKLAYSQLAAINPEDQQGLIEDYGKIVAAGNASGKDVRDLTRLVIDQMTDTIGSPGAENRALAIDAAQAFTDNVKSNAKANLDRALALARNQDEINEAWRDYIDSLDPDRVTRNVQAQRRDAQDRLRRNTAAKQRLRAQLDKQLRREMGLPVLDSILRGASSTDVAAQLRDIEEERKRLEDELRDRRKEGNKIRKELDGLNRAEKLLTRRARELQQEARQEKYDDRTDTLESLNALEESRAPDGIERLRVQLQNLNAMLARERRAGKLGDPNRIRELLQQRNDLLGEIFDYNTSLVGARFDYQIAGLSSDDEIGRARLELAKARALAARASEKGDPLEALEAATEVRQAEQDLADAIAERADAIAAARFELLRARADDNEVKAARISLREARRALRTADTREERLSARADLVSARHELRDARAQREIEDVEYAADIGKLSLQAQITQYQRILHTMELTRDLRRDLRRRIYDLKQQMESEAEGFDLAVGDIKLPTVYEIRRAIGGGINAGPNVTINQTNNYSAHGSDANEIVGRIGNQQRDAANRNRNAMRSAGLV